MPQPVHIDPMHEFRALWYRCMDGGMPAIEEAENTVWSMWEYGLIPGILAQGMCNMLQVCPEGEARHVATRSWCAYCGDIPVQFCQNCCQHYWKNGGLEEEFEYAFLFAQERFLQGHRGESAICTECMYDEDRSVLIEDDPLPFAEAFQRYERQKKAQGGLKWNDSLLCTYCLAAAKYRIAGENRCQHCYDCELTKLTRHNLWRQLRVEFQEREHSRVGHADTCESGELRGSDGCGSGEAICH